MINPAGIAEGVGGLLNSAYGIYQLHKGNQMLKGLQRPEYQIPDEIKNKLTAAQQAAMEGLPTEQKQQFINNIQRSQNFGLNALADRKAGLTGISTLVQNSNDAAGDLLAQDSQARMRNQQMLGQVQSEVAGYKDKQFELNQFNPYLQKYQTGQGMVGAGTQNIAGGLQSLISGAVNSVNPLAGLGAQKKVKKSPPMVGDGGLQGFDPSTIA